MDLNDIAGGAVDLHIREDDEASSESVHIASETSVGDASIEYMTVVTGFEHENPDTENFHCDPSDPSIIYDDTGQPVNMGDLAPQEKVITAVEECLVIHREGNIKEEESDDEELLHIDINGPIEESASSVSLPCPVSEDVIASAMMELGVGGQPGATPPPHVGLDLTASKEITFWVVPEGSSRGRDKLYDSLGFSYTIKSKNQTSVSWRCKMRTKKFCCRARVVQKGSHFTREGGEHNHDISGKYIEIPKPEPPQKVHSVSWDVTPIPKIKKRKRKIKELLAPKEMIKHKRLKTDGGILRIAFDQAGATSSTTTKTTVVVVETPLLPRNKRKTAMPRQVLPESIKTEADGTKTGDETGISDCGELMELQDSDEFISPGLRQTKIQADQPSGSQEQEDEDCDMESENGKLTYRIIHGGSARRSDKLFDSLGYSYTLKRVNSDSVTWRCTWRHRQKIICGATVKQWGKVFIPSRIPHKHQPRVGEELNTVLTQKMKEMSQSTPERPLPEIAREQIGEIIASGVPEAAIPKLDNLLRKAHHFKRNTMLKNPKTIDFKLDRSLIPNDFLRDDLRIVDARHFVFATDDQLKLLKQSKLWYIDCAICVENKPFYQLMTVHVFVRKDESVKQVPALFAFMSRKTLDDYTAVLQSIKLCIQDKTKLKRVVLQYESSIWNACNIVFPGVKKSGCAFHFQQCIYDKVVELGLKNMYEEDQIVKVFVKHLMVLAMVPYEFVGVLFTPMERKAPSKDLCSSFRKMWLETQVWTLKNISGFDSPVRTDDDTNGWNRCLNRMGWSKASLYLMVQKLFNDFSTECEGCQTISEKDLKQHQRKQGSDMQRKIFKLWKSYQNGGKSPKGLMKSLAQHSVY